MTRVRYVVYGTVSTVLRGKQCGNDGGFAMALNHPARGGEVKDCGLGNIMPQGYIASGRRQRGQRHEDQE